MAVAGQHPAQREPHLRRQPDHGAVGPQRGALLFQVSRLSPESFPPAYAAWAPPHLGQTRPTEPAACQVPAPWTALSPGAGGAQPDHPPLGGLGVPTSRPVRATTGPPSSCNRPFPKPRWEGPLQGQSRQGGALPGLGLLCTCWQAPPTPRSRTPLRSMVSGYSRASPRPASPWGHLCRPVPGPDLQGFSNISALDLPKLCNSFKISHLKFRSGAQGVGRLPKAHGWGQPSAAAPWLAISFHPHSKPFR